MRQDRFKENNFLVSEEKYKSLLRSVDWIEGFGLLFVECSPAQGNQIIERIREDLPEKKVEVLHLQEAIDDLYDRIANLPELDKINVVFIKGLEVSLYEYEETMLKDSDERYKYPWSSVPRILGNLNFQRERFRDDFNICFVFLLPNFAIKYFINRAPDFFDWSSGVFEFARDPEGISFCRFYLRDINCFQSV